jgi:hypothetical protein
MKDSSPKAQIQKDKALQVYTLILTNPDITQVAACAQIGIDPKTYRKWIALQDEALAQLEQTRIEIDRLDYADYLTKRSEISNQFVADAMKPGVSITERIKALEYIDEKINEFSSRYHTVDVEAEQDLLSGPKTEAGISSSKRMEDHT